MFKTRHMEPSTMYKSIVKLSCVFLVFCIIPACMGDDSTNDQEHVNGVYVKDCKFPTHKTWTPQEHQSLWELAPLIGKSFKTTDEDLPHPVTSDCSYTYSVGICVSPDAVAEGSKSVTAVRQKCDKTEASYELGQLNNTSFMTGTDWVMLEYRGGKEYTTHCLSENRRTVVMIICSPNEKNGILRLIEENNVKESDCFYLFELEHYSVCTNESSGLSIGSIICIVFLCAVSVYLLGGFMYQRFVVGAKGSEQIPHIHFWRDFGNLQADGCDLLCRCGFKNSTRTYRGVGDDQLGGTDEREPMNIHEDRDDNILPM